MSDEQSPTTSVTGETNEQPSLSLAILRALRSSLLYGHEEIPIEHPDFSGRVHSFMQSGRAGMRTLSFEIERREDVGEKRYDEEIPADKIFEKLAKTAKMNVREAGAGMHKDQSYTFPTGHYDLNNVGSRNDEKDGLTKHSDIFSFAAADAFRVDGAIQAMITKLESPAERLEDGAGKRAQL